MKTAKILQNQPQFETCLYPTFKEWKLPRKSPDLPTIVSLYPTFKEWKHIPLAKLPIQRIRLYPTFKEWKQEFGFGMLAGGLFISYL